jgi:hypothetical protein
LARGPLTPHSARPVRPAYGARLATKVGTALVALALAVSGCALTFDSTHLGVPVTMAEAAQAPDRGGPGQAPAAGTPFHVTKHPVYLFLGLISVSRPNLEDVLAGQVGTATSVASLKIKVRSRWSDLLVTALTLGLIVPRSVTFEGVVVGGRTADSR